MRKPNEITVNGVTLDVILDLHIKWHRGVEGGKRAYLSDAYLSDANLYGANLTGAYLSDANLSEPIKTASRVFSVSMELLKKWGACDEGRRYVESVGGSITVAMLFEAGKDDYLRWLHGRVVMHLIAEAKKAEVK
jgi:hypothetical protein